MTLLEVNLEAWSKGFMGLNLTPDDFERYLVVRKEREERMKDGRKLDGQDSV